MPSLLFLVTTSLVCAVDWQTPDGTIHQGAFVYLEEYAIAIAEYQKLAYPDYKFFVRCQK